MLPQSTWVLKEKISAQFPHTVGWGRRRKLQQRQQERVISRRIERTCVAESGINNLAPHVCAGTTLGPFPSQSQSESHLISGTCTKIRSGLEPAFPLPGSIISSSVICSHRRLPVNATLIYTVEGSGISRDLTQNHVLDTDSLNILSRVLKPSYASTFVFDIHSWPYDRMIASNRGVLKRRGLVIISARETN